MQFSLCVILLALVVAAQSLTDEQKANWKKWSEECQTETGASSEAINKIRNNDFTSPDDKIKAHSLCFGKKSGLIDASGDIDVEKVRTKLGKVVDNEDQVSDIVNKCVVKKDSHEETAFEVFKCLRQNRPTFTPV